MRFPDKYLLFAAMLATAATCTGASIPTDTELAAKTVDLSTPSFGLAGRTWIKGVTRTEHVGYHKRSSSKSTEKRDHVDGAADVGVDSLRRKIGNTRRQLLRHEKNANSKDAENGNTIANITERPTEFPTHFPTKSPTFEPSASPSAVPTTSPSDQPSGSPSAMPSLLPSVQPSALPSYEPSTTPTDKPSSTPTDMPSTQPSGVPSVAPSKSPSVAPSGTPTSQPTDQPSMFPSAVPTSFPSHRPSIPPTSAPSPLPSVHPSETPTSVPSVAPSTTTSEDPSPAPSVAPTVISSSSPSASLSDEPSFQPTFSPTTRCFLNPDGSFGNVTGSTEMIVVDYNYEVEMNTPAVQSVWLSAVESAINDALLPLLFSDLCSNETDARRALLENGEQVMGLRGIRRMQAKTVALSPNPPDLVQTGDICLNIEKITPGRSCVVVRGGLSIYGLSTSDEDASRTREAVTDAIKIGMEGDAFVYAHPAIVRMFFVQHDGSISLVDTQTESEANSDLVADGRSPFPWVIAACISSLAVFGVVVGWKKLSKKQEGEDDDYDEQSLSAKRSLPLACLQGPEDDDLDDSRKMVGVEDINVDLSDSDETQDPPATMSAVHGLQNLK